MTDQKSSTRREILRKGAVGAGLGTLAAAGSPAYSAAAGHGGRSWRGRVGGPTFVFVHGGWSSGFNYHGVVTQLVVGGRRALAVDLPGHGQQALFPASYLSQDLAALETEPSPSAGITLDSCVDYVTRVVRQIARRSGPVVLLGHSSGGIVIGKVADRVPHLIDRLVYMAAYMVVERASAFEYFDPRGSFPNVDQLGVLRVNWRSPVIRANFKAGLFALHSDAVFAAFANTWQPDFPLSFLTVESRVDKRTWGTIPRTFIRFTDDGTFPVSLQDGLIAEADALTPRNPTDVHSVPGGHIDPFASPAALVGILEALS